MKKTLKMMALLFVAATMTLTGCEKDPQTDNGGNGGNGGNGTNTGNILARTTWESNIEDTIEYSGVQMELTFNATLDFFDEKNGELFQDIYLYVPIMPSASQSMNDTEPFTYVFAGDSCVMNFEYYDEDEGDTLNYSLTAKYNRSDESLTLDFNEPEMEQIIGTDKIVFHKRNANK